jgi:DNA polymerase/3'-5' exonuclease PolX
MEYFIARFIAEKVKEDLSPHCERCEIAGSIRRRNPEPKDIEIVAIPKPYDTGLFESGIATVVNKWPGRKGHLPCKYTQRYLPADYTGTEGIVLDLFFATPENWGLIYAIRTGSADYSHYVLAGTWARLGYKSVNGMLVKNGKKIAVREEGELFRMLGIKWTAPEERL